jgi:fructose-bisphosphate aldolase, class I
MLSLGDNNEEEKHAILMTFVRSVTGGTGYLSILPVDQGIEHSAGASFAPNPIYFDPENIVKLAIEGGCNAVASTFGVLGRWRASTPTRSRSSSSSTTTSC